MRWQRFWSTVMRRPVALTLAVVTVFAGCTTVGSPSGTARTASSLATAKPHDDCVALNAAVGDKITAPDGTVAEVKTLAGKTAHCDDPRRPVPAEIGPVTKTASTFSRGAISNSEIDCRKKCTNLAATPDVIACIATCAPPPGEIPATMLVDLAAACMKYYPLESRVTNEEGTVTLLLNVSTEGFVTQTMVEHSSGIDRLDAAASACALAEGRLSPFRRNGVAVSSWQRWSVHWHPMASTPANR